MVNVIVKKAFIDILKNYIDTGEECVEKLSDILSANNFDFTLKYQKYDSAINHHVAQLIIDYQNTMYKIAALFLYGDANVRKLTLKEKELFELAFIVSPGCTNISENIGKYLERILKLIPQEHRAITLIATLIIFFGYMSYNDYLDNQKIQNKDEIILEVTSSAMDKLSRANNTLASIIEKNEKDQLNNLPKIDNNISLNGDSYTKDEIETVKNKKYPTQKEQKTISTINGIYRIRDIKLIDGGIVVENEKDGKITILYDIEDDSLLSVMNDIKANLKKAIDNEKRFFQISYVIVRQNGKINSRILKDIKEVDSKY